MQSSDISQEAERYIDLQGEKPPEHSTYPDNSIISSRYTKYTFLPKTLFAQFISIPKLWFLLISIFELSGLSTITLPCSTILPLALLIFLDLIREALNDYKCHQSDKIINSQENKVWNGNAFLDKECKDILVGDVILLVNNDTAPADMLVLCVGNEEHECYADVSSVIGESNLKVKHPVKDVQDKVDCLDLDQACLLLRILNADILINSPCKSFKKFTGKLKLDIRPRWTSLDSNNLLLRGMRIQNTPWIFGVALYTGIETKVWINNLNRPTKISRTRKILDEWTLWALAIAIIVAVVNTLIYIGNPLDGYHISDVFIGNLVLFNHFVQVSLYLSIELVRIFTYLYNFSSGPIEMSNFNLFSNLGMIEYIVTDKTGTLTDNYLDVSLVIINNVLYLNEKTEDEEENKNDMSIGTKRKLTTRISYDHLLFTDIQVELERKSEKFELFFMCLAICNLSFPLDDGFVAISEDDKVLARTAYQFGFKMIFRSSEMIMLLINEQEVQLDIIGTQAFSSDIKKSRIIVRRQDTNQFLLFVKGNRDAMINIYDHSSYERNDLEDCIIQFRTLFLGFRELDETELKTFVFDYQTALLSPVNRQGRVENVFLKIEKKVEFLGIVGLEDVVSEDTKDTVEELKKAGIKFWVVSGDSEDSTLTAAVAAGIFQTENKIIRLGGFSSELECMNSLQEAIKENIFTSKSIERSSMDIEPHMPKLRPVMSEMLIPYAQSANSMSVEDMIPLAIPRKNKRRSTLVSRDEVRKVSIHPLISKLPIKRQLTSLKGEYNPKSMKFILSIDSSTLEYGMSTKDHQLYFTSLLFTAKAVCFHGLLPDHKSKVVRLIKNNFRFNPLVLSIGDGVSDIGMIQVSDIGVGIKGKEGSEAYLNADVSIQKFSQLKELILTKGHRHYIQFSKMILLSIYVMVLLESSLIFYAPLTAWTAGSVFFAELMTVYRLVINIFPIACMCILDSDCSLSFLTPKIYRAGIFNSLLNLKNLGMYILTALIQAGFTFLCTELYFNGIDTNGMTENYLLVSVSLFYILSTTVFITILIETYSIDYRILILYILCIVLMIVSTVPLTVTNDNMLGYTQFFLESSSIWVFLTLTVLFNSLVTYFFKAFRYIFVPNIIERIRLMVPSASFKLFNRLSQYKKTLQNVYKESNILAVQSAYDDNAINNKKLKFISKQREQLYQTDKLAENDENFKILLMLGGFSMLIYSIYYLTYQGSSASSVAFHIIFSCLMLASTYITRFLNIHIYSKIYLVTSYLFMQVFYIISTVAFGYICLPMLPYLPVLYLIGFSNFWLELTLLVTISSTLSGITLIFSFIFANSDGLTIINIIDYFIIYISICLTASLVAYHIDKSKREEFVLVQKVQVEIAKRNCVLGYLLPAFVMKRVENGIRYISDYQGIVSIIFCDIYNFESILRTYSPQELAAFFDEVYGRFDQICMLSGCTKIETVGKTYMACAGLKDSESELDPYYSSVPHARRCIEMGLAIIRNSEKIYLKNREVLQFKIGINSGPVTAGVVGFHKPQFSLVGDTVNTASRMASLCPQANTLQISSDTMELVGDKTGLIFEPSQVDAKGKGVMKTFLVSVPEGQNINSPVKNTSISGSISQMFSLKNPRTVKGTKKITLYQISNGHRESDKRKSSIIEELGSQVAVGNDFVKRKTMGLEKVQIFSIGCNETREEKKFRVKISENTYPIVKYGMILRIIDNILVIILIILKLSLGYLSSFESLTKLLIETVVVSVILFFLKKNYKNLWFCWITVSACLIGSIFRFTDENLHPELSFVKYIYHLLLAAHCTQLLFKNLKLAVLSVVIVHIIYASIMRHENWILHILANLIFFSILIYTIYTRENKLRVFKIIKRAALKKIEKSEALLAEMMPKHAYENLKDYISVTESITKVTLLYADIVGFTEWSSKKRPDEVVNMLSELFQEFDRKCKESEVYKVHTIGDCYVAMGYTGVRPRNENVECYRMAKFALSLVDIIKQKNKENNTNLNMRIGVHTGNIIGGIIGTNIVRYDIYGIDVYIANKMESSGKAGSVKVSEATMEILHSGWPQSFIFNRDSDVYANVNNSRIKTYYMEKNPAENL